MAFDLDRAVRRVERQTGCEVEITRDGEGMPYALMAVDPELGGRVFAKSLGTRSAWQKNVDKLHEDIYHERSREKHRLQGGKCCKCGHPLREFGEANHIKHRGKNGRDDRMGNLEIVCPPFMGGCNWHRQEHGERVKT